MSFKDEVVLPIIFTPLLIFSRSREDLGAAGVPLKLFDCIRCRYLLGVRRCTESLITRLQSRPLILAICRCRYEVFTSPHPSAYKQRLQQNRALFLDSNMAEIHNAPIVLDNGSGTIRAGFAGEDLPKCYFPSFVGRPKHLRVLAGALEGDVFIGQKAQELRGLLKIRYPLEHGIVTDWDDMERIWQYVYQEELKTMSEEVRDIFCFETFD